MELPSLPHNYCKTGLVFSMSAPSLRTNATPQPPTPPPEKAKTFFFSRPDTERCYLPKFRLSPYDISRFFFLFPPRPLWFFSPATEAKNAAGWKNFWSGFSACNLSGSFFWGGESWGCSTMQGGKRRILYPLPHTLLVLSKALAFPFLLFFHSNGGSFGSGRSKSGLGMVLKFMSFSSLFLFF